MELFFKWIKQRLRIKSFLGTSETAVKTQIWIAISVYLIVALIKNGYKQVSSYFVPLPCAPIKPEGLSPEVPSSFPSV